MGAIGSSILPSCAARLFPVTAICLNWFIARNTFLILHRINSWNENLTVFATMFEEEFTALQLISQHFRKVKPFLTAPLQLAPVSCMISQGDNWCQSNSMWCSLFSFRAGSLRHHWLHPLLSLHTYFWQMPVCSLDECSQALICSAEIQMSMSAIHQPEKQETKKEMWKNDCLIANEKTTPSGLEAWLVQLGTVMVV